MRSGKSKTQIKPARAPGSEEQNNKLFKLKSDFPETKRNFGKIKML
jgi:hypothetical protein